jgi:pimeloyl-ACP methyl ester carboxylesterase
VVHYELGGPEDGPFVVLVHGFSVPYFIWDPTFIALGQSGFRVLRYDLFGRGYSDKPHLPYDGSLFDKQLFDLMDVLGVEKIYGLVGLSLGGVIAANYCVRHPGKVEKLILVDPAGFPLEIPQAFKLLFVPVLGELLFGLMSGKMLENAMADDFYDRKHVRDFADMYRPQMEYKGFRRALLSTMREGLLDRGVGVFRQLGKMETPPVLLVWGEEDKSVPFRFSKVFITLVPRTEFFPVENSGHIPHYEHADQVNPVILEFLNGR